MPAAGGPHRGEHAAVVGHQQDRAVEAVQRRLQLLDRGQVEVVGRLVEHQQVDLAGLQQRERGAGALARREAGRPDGRRAPRRARTSRAACASRARAAGRSRRGTPPATFSSPRKSARAWSISPIWTREPSVAVPSSRGMRPRSAPSRVDFPDPFAPVTHAVGPVDAGIDRAERELAPTHHRVVQRGDDRAGARRRGDRHAQLPFPARLLDDLQARSMRSVWRALAPASRWSAPRGA